MKLWLKQTLLSLSIVFVIFSTCLYLFVASETNNILDIAVKSAESNLSSFCSHVASAASTSLSSTPSDYVKQTVIQYAFAEFAHLTQNTNDAYSLTMDGTYLYNITSVNPLKYLPVLPNVSSSNCLIEADGDRFLIVYKAFDALELTMGAYYTQNISQITQNISGLARTAQIALIGCLLATGIAMPLFIRGTLAPLKRLIRVARQIANGDYTLRSGIVSTDEVGVLAASFDTMAESLAQKIIALQEDAKNRELLLGALTHEIKTPMTSIIGFSDTLTSVPLTEESRMEAVQQINEAALRAERLSQKMMQLLLVRENPVMVKKKIAINRLFEQVEKLSSSYRASKQISLKLHYEVQYIMGDADLLICLMTNLVDNAVKASQPMSDISVSAFMREGYVCLEVSDHGIGIPEDQIARVTEPFYRVDKARSRKLGGAGLGLALCQIIARSHNGKIEICSEVDKGTTISVLLPKEC